MLEGAVCFKGERVWNENGERKIEGFGIWFGHVPQSMAPRRRRRSPRHAPVRAALKGARRLRRRRVRIALRRHGARASPPSSAATAAGDAMVACKVVLFCLAGGGEREMEGVGRISDYLT